GGLGWRRGGIFAVRPSLDHYGNRPLLRRRLLLRSVGIVIDANLHGEGVDVGRCDTRAAAERRVPPEVRLPEVGLDSGAAVPGLHKCSAGKNYATETARNAWGSAGRTARENDAAKVTVGRLAERTSGQCQRKDNGERFHGKPPLTKLYRQTRGQTGLTANFRQIPPETHGSLVCPGGYFFFGAGAGADGVVAAGRAAAGAVPAGLAAAARGPGAGVARAGSL